MKKVYMGKNPLITRFYWILSNFLEKLFMHLNQFSTLAKNVRNGDIFYYESGFRKFEFLVVLTGKRRTEKVRENQINKYNSVK